MQKDNYVKAVTGSFLTVLVLSAVLFGCGREHKNRRSSHDGSNKNNSDEATGDDQVLSDAYAALGLRNFDQISETMAVVTGVDPNLAAVKAVFQTVRTQLPGSNDLKSFIASHQVGVSKLAIEYCDGLVNSTKLRTNVSANFNFAAAPNQAFNGSSKTDLIEGFLDKFWGKGLDNLPDRGESVELLSGLLDDLLSGENLATVAVTAKVAKGLCTAVLSSASVMIF